MNHPDANLLEKAKNLIETLRRGNPKLTFQRTDKMLLASAYYIVASQEGNPISCIRTAKLFKVSNNQLLSYLKILSEAGLHNFKFMRAGKWRNVYDLYAEILAKDGRTITQLIYDICIMHSELKKHLNELLDKGLITKQVKGNSDIYNSTEKGRVYLKHYQHLKNLL